MMINGDARSYDDSVVDDGFCLRIEDTPVYLGRVMCRCTVHGQGHGE
jgi:hypothetical protein